MKQVRYNVKEATVAEYGEIMEEKMNVMPIPKLIEKVTEICKKNPGSSSHNIRKTT